MRVLGNCFYVHVCFVYMPVSRNNNNNNKNEDKVPPPKLSHRCRAMEEAVYRVGVFEPDPSVCGTKHMERFQPAWVPPPLRHKGSLRAPFHFGRVLFVSAHLGALLSFFFLAHSKTCCGIFRLVRRQRVVQAAGHPRPR